MTHQHGQRQQGADLAARGGHRGRSTQEIAQALASIGYPISDIVRVIKIISTDWGESEAGLAQAMKDWDASGVAVAAMLQEHYHTRTDRLPALLLAAGYRLEEVTYVIARDSSLSVELAAAALIAANTSVPAKQNAINVAKDMKTYYGAIDRTAARALNGAGVSTVIILEVLNEVYRADMYTAAQAMRFAAGKMG